MVNVYKKTDKYTLYFGDVLETLKDLPSDSVDMIITSPPYNLNLTHRKDTNVAHYDSYDDDMSWEDYCEWQRKILDECYRIVKDGGVLFYNHKDKFREETYYNPIKILFNTKWKIKQNIIWDRICIKSFNAGMFGDLYENIYYCYKGESPKTKTKHNIMTTIWRIMPDMNNEHPAPFPLELPLRAIYSIYDEEKDKVIMDIFNGSGTTGVASLLLGHRYIGIDISEKYLKMSSERLDNYLNELDKGQEEVNRHSVKQQYVSLSKINGLSDKVSLW